MSSTTRETTAHVARLGTTPIKGFGIRESSELFISETGVAGDRAFFVMDANRRLVSATRTACFLPLWADLDPAGEVLTIGRGDRTLMTHEATRGLPVRAHFFADRYASGHVVEGPWGRVLSELGGEPLQLVRAAGPLGGYDVHRLSVVSQASAWALGNEHDGAPLDTRRFRMTITLGGVAPFTEDAWTGRSLRIGECVVRVVEPVRRCAAVQKHPGGRGNRVDPLRRINEVRGPTTSVAGRGLHLGVYAEVERPGLVRVGDDVEPADTHG